jgi:hypothetical protein
MSNDWPFNVHKNDRFVKLIQKLEELKIVELKNKKSGNSIKLNLLEPKILLEVFRTIFFLYASPARKNQGISFCQTTNRLIIKGDCIDFALINPSTDKAKQILSILITKEDDFIYESAFNALISIYLGTFEYLDMIFPNTYITELGKKTHEFDILLGTHDKKCIVVETTRGFDKETDNIDETYTWHFKKALFRKWMIEKIYNVECHLCYLTLKELTDSAPKEAVPEELSDETDDTSETNPLISKLLEMEGNKLQIIDLGAAFKNSFNEEELDSLLMNEIVEKLKELFTV